MKGLTLGLGLLAVGVVGGASVAVTRFPVHPGATIGQGSRSTSTAAPAPGVVGKDGLGFGTMVGSAGTGGMMSSAMNAFTGNTRAAMGFVGNRSGGMMGAAGRQLLTHSQVNALVHQGEQGATINHATHTITYHTHQVLLVPLAAPAALHLRGMQWEINGVINPTIVVPHGARITVDLVNADQGYLHGFEVTSARPPFSEWAMMQGRAAFSGSFIMPIAPETPQGQWIASTQFDASRPGTYYYICPVPGHAAKGMVGSFVVG